MLLKLTVPAKDTANNDKSFYQADENVLTLGLCSYINGLELQLGGRNFSRMQALIGRYCSLGYNLLFLIARNHDYKAVSTNPKFTRVTETFKNPRQIIIGHDVWIGHGVTILGGVKIGTGAVIGANAVVAKDIPPYAIAVGNPVRVVKYRFDEETIKKFLAVKWWNWDLEKIADNLPLTNDVEKFLETHYSPELEEFPDDDFTRQLSNVTWGGGYLSLYHRLPSAEAAVA